MSHSQPGAGLLDGLGVRLAASSSSSAAATSSSRNGTKRNALVANLDPPSSKRQQLESSAKLSEYTRKLALAESDLGRAKSQLREANAKIESLERDRRLLSDREQEETRARLKERTAAEEEIQNLQTALAGSRQELASIQQDYEDLKDDLSDLRLTSSNTIAQQQAALEMEQNARRVPRFSDISDAPTDEDATRNMEFTMPSLSSSLSAKPPHAAEADTTPEQSFAFTKDESDLLTAQLSKMTQHVEEVELKNTQLEAELVILRQRKDKVVVIEEQKRELQTRLSRMENYREQCIQLQAALDAEKKKSNASNSDAGSAQQQSLLAAELMKLRSEHLSLLDTHGELKATLSKTQHELSFVQEQLELTTNSKDSAFERLNDLEESLHQLSASREREQREIEYLKGVVSSYQAEIQVASSTPSTQEEEILRKHVAELEALLQEYKDENAKMKSRSSNPSQLSSSTSSRHLPGTFEQHIAQLQSERDKFETENAALLDKIDHLEQRIHDLYGDMAVGSHVPPNTKVLQLRDNPMQQWFDTREELVMRLKKEGEALRERVKELEGLVGTGSSSKNLPDNSGLVPRESWDNLQQEKLKLEEEIKSKDKRSLRLKEVFTAKGEEFRQAVASILGVKLTFHASGQIRVTSIYDLNASFVFRPIKSTPLAGSGGGEGGIRMELIAMNETPNEEIPAMMKHWIEEQQCPPGFMASVTLEAWERAIGGGGTSLSF